MSADALLAAREATRRQVEALGAVAVVRLHSTEAAIRVAEALHEGGVHALEITFTVPDACSVIEAVTRRFGDAVCVGAGTVLEPATAREAIEAGARYVVSPALRPQVIAEAHRLGVPAMPGGLTPTEVLTAHELGADIVKIFPADSVGPAFIKGLLAPMPFLRLMPTGGVTPENVGTWLAAGAVAVGLGGALVDGGLVARGEWGAITRRAREVAQGVARAREARAHHAGGGR